MKIATKALKQSHPVGFENTNGRQKGLRKGSNENENSLGLLLLIEQKTVSARATETQKSHVATTQFLLFVNNAAHEHVYWVLFLN